MTVTNEILWGKLVQEKYELLSQNFYIKKIENNSNNPTELRQRPYSQYYIFFVTFVSAL
jgi:hypothetical protein